MSVGDRFIAEKRVTVVCLRRTDIHSNIGANERRRADARVLKCFPRELKQDALLRINLNSFARRNAEYCRIESPNVIENACCPRVTLPALLATRVPKASERKSLFRDPRNGATALKEKRPQFVNGIRTG
jgi:hypothetical protein